MWVRLAGQMSGEKHRVGVYLEGGRSSPLWIVRMIAHVGDVLAWRQEDRGKTKLTGRPWIS